MDLEKLEEMIQTGESNVLEFKKSTALLQGIAETLCGFLNSKGGVVLIGVTADRKIVGQHVSDSTLQEIASLIAKFEPPTVIEFDRLPVRMTKKFLSLLWCLEKQTCLTHGKDVPINELDRLLRECPSRPTKNIF